MDNILGELKTRNGLVEKREDGIIVLSIWPHVKDTNVDYLQEDVNAITQLCQNEKTPFLMVGPSMEKFGTDEKVFVQKNTAKFATAYAMVIKSGVSSYLANIVMYMHRPAIPCKVFTDKDQAITWLQKYL
jgi:hypothetical protein